MSEDIKQQLTTIGLEEGYSEEELNSMIELGNELFGGLL